MGIWTNPQFIILIDILPLIVNFFYSLKNKILLFKANRQGVFFYNVHEYSATLKWNNIKKVTFGKLENKFLYICFQTNDDILYFYKHPKREVLWFLKGLFRHYSGNKNLDITTIKNDYFYIPVRKPISEQEYLDEDNRSSKRIDSRQGFFRIYF